MFKIGCRVPGLDVCWVRLVSRQRDWFEIDCWVVM